jgi:amino acid adenylation domain-containing protein/non-ribosomal peptide synthase protein (TIGR01720 family)
VDLARWREDGVLEYQGRVDHQVKIRGLRIELGEIEAQLLRQAGVAEAVVVAAPGPAGTRLVGYVSPRPGHAIDAHSLRQGLAQVLPDYMVPALVQVLEALPLNANGKIDRKALPAPDLAEGRLHEPPAGEAEEAVAAAWSQVLGIERIGRHDNFFELGGDSIVSLQIVARLRAMGWRVTPRQMFERQGLAQLASVAQRIAEAEEPPRAAASIVEGEVPLLPFQSDFFDTPMSHRHHWNQSVLLHCDEPLRLAELRAALRALVEHHDSLRLTYRRAPDGRWIQRYEPVAQDDLQEMLWVRQAQEASRIEALCEEAQGSLDLGRGPLLRALAIQLQDGSARLLLVAHHLVVDGVSWRILVEDLRTAYEQACAGERISLPPKTASLADWAQALQAHARDRADEFSFWEAQSQALSQVQSQAGSGVPVLEAGGSNTAGDQDVLEFALGAAETEALLTRAPAAYRTQVNDILLTALGRALCAWSGTEQVVIDLEGHGREDIPGGADLSRTIGWFTTVFPVVLRPLGEPEAALKRVKEALRAIPGKGVGHGVFKAMGSAQQRAALSAAAAPAVAFNYLGRIGGDAWSSGPWRPARERGGSNVHPGAPQRHELFVQGRVVDARLTMEISFSRARHDAKVIGEVAKAFQAELRQVLALCTSGRAGATPSDFPLTRLTQGQIDAMAVDFANVEDIYPLAPMQQGLLLHTLANPGSGIYLMQDRYRFESAIDVPRFIAAWDQVVQAHEALRTGFLWSAGDEPLQFILKKVPSPVEYIDWLGVDEEEAKARIDRLLQDELARGLDLSRPPLFKVRLVRLREDRYHAVMSFQHILMDAWCRALLLKVFFHYYDGPDAGAAALPSPRPFRDFIEWLQRQDIERSREFWRQELAGFDVVTPLPFRQARKRAAGEPEVCDVVERLEPGEIAALQDYAQGHQLTVNTVVQGAWALLMARLAQLDEVLFGVTVAGRPLELKGIQETVGLFINTVPLKVRVGRPTERIAPWLVSLMARNLEMRQHEHLPLVDIQSLSAVPRGRSLFDCIFVFENAPGDAHVKSRAGSLGVSSEGNRTHTNYPLTIVIEPGERFILQATYETRCFERADVERLVKGLREMLRQMVSRPDLTFDQIGLGAWGGNGALSCMDGPACGYPFDRGYMALLAEQVRLHPSRVAARCGEQTMAYAALERTAHRIGAALRHLGVGRDELVALHADRGIELLSMVLGTFSAGGAYLAVDRRQPDRRLAAMLESSGAKIVLTRRADAAGLRQALARMARPPRVVAYEELLDREPSPDCADGPPSVDQAAYAIYTSGSTGEPKGVVVTQQGMLNNLLGKLPFLGLTPEDVIAQTASQSFDISVWQLLAGLLCGACIEIVPDETARDPKALLGLAQARGVTVLQCVPSLIQAMLQVERVELPRLRWMLPTGEACTAELARRWFAAYPSVPLVNAYGPAECADDVALYRLSEAPDAEASQVPIGYPTDNTRLKVLGSMLEALPRGIAGELFVAGVGVGRGYLGRPGLTAERFVADPDGGGARMYRTGDLARCAGGGALEYLGRADQQVKIRGQRIELGEVDAQLVREPGVHEAAVAVHQDERGDRWLVGHVVPQHGAVPLADADALRAWQESLRERLALVLPEYMIPSLWVAHARLPLNRNGKVDRKALPAPDLSSSRRRYEPPQGAVEEAVAAIWSSILHVEQVGRRDSFFELGGHSLMAIQLMERLRQHGWSVGVQSLFRNPVLADFCREVASLPGQQREVEVPPNLIEAGCAALRADMLTLVSLEDGHLRAIEAAVPGGAPNIQDIYPLAPLQEGILFHHLLKTDADPYVLPYLIAFDSRDRLEGFVATLNRVVERHDLLRTLIVWANLPEPVQVVLRRAEVELEWLDDGEAPLEDGRSVAERLNACVDHARYRIDVRRAPMIRAIAAQDVPHGRWLLQLPSHHLILDHTTLELLRNEVVAIQDGREDELEEPVPFRNFVARARLGLRASGHEAYFRQMLGDVEEPTAPFGLLDVQGDGTRARELAWHVNADTAARIRALARLRNVTPAAVFHLVWALVLARTTTKDDVVFGTLLFGRMQGSSGIERAVGMFINTLPIRVRLGELSVEEGLRRTHDTLTELLEHEHASLTLANRCSGVANGTPLFSALLNYRHSTPGARRGEGGASAPGMEVIGGEERTNYPFTLSVDDFGEGFGVVVRTDDAIEVERVAAYVERATDWVAANLELRPTARMAEFQMVEGEELQALQAWGEARPAQAQPQALHRLIEERSRMQPAATALVHEGHTLSYAELNEQANRLARHLVGQGVGAESRIGLALERSISMVTALLAVLKTGAAYVPLDPELPAERLAYLIGDSGMDLLLTTEALRGRVLSCGAPVEVLMLDRLDLGAESALDLEIAVHVDQLAYVIYTSGSTGKPKGAQLSHRNVSRLLSETQPWYRFGPEDVWTLFHSYAFDFSVWEIFGALCTGGTLVIVPYWVSRSPAEFLKLLREQRVTVLNQTPSAFQQLIHAEGLSKPEATEPPLGLRLVIFGGEALEVQSLRPWFERFGDERPRLVNMYGITETTVHVTYRPITIEDLEGARRSPVGAAIADLGLRVLDSRMRPQPIGVAGEIHVAGEGLARGYLNRPGLSAERFVADPHGPAGARLYRTGDLARWRADGQLEFLGRIDHQVKIRGFRIELGEIESQLLAMPGVKAAIVVASSGLTGQRLTAYVAQGAAGRMSEADLREQLRRVLPDYMVPAAIVVLEELPLNANGKVDRRALPEPLAGDARDFEPPRGDLEARIAKVWAEVLGVPRVGRQDNFFELGGHSLLAIQLLERLRQQGMDVGVKTLFLNAVLSDFAASLEAVEEGEVQGPADIAPSGIAPGCEAITPEMLPLVGLRPQQIRLIEAAVAGGARNIQDIYPLAPLQQGILFHHLLQDQGDVYVNSLLLSFSTKELLLNFMGGLNEVIARHDILRTAFFWEDLPVPVQVVLREAPLEIQWLDSPGDGADVAQALIEVADSSRFRIDVRRAPLLGAIAARDAAHDRWLLQLPHHHLIMDHTSDEILIDEISLILQGRRGELRPPVPFRRFVAQAGSGVSEAQHEAFFRSMLGDVTESTMPFGLNDVQGDGRALEEFRLSLDAALACQVREQARRTGVSAATLFHLAWALVLSKTSGADDVVFGTVLFGRMRAGSDADRALGLFINTLPMRVRLGGSTLQECLAQTQATLTGLLHHEHASLTLAQRCSGMPAGAVLFSSLLNYRHIAGAGRGDGADPAWTGMRQLDFKERTNYPLMMSVDDLGDGFDLVAQLAPEVGARRVCSYMRTALQWIVGSLDTGRRADELDIVSAAEQALFHRSGRNPARHDDLPPVHRLIERQVEASPEAIAVVFEDEAISYGELNAQANRLAHHLLGMGVGAETRVGIAIERSPQMLVGLLAVLKSGAAYVPLDPQLPADRLRYMIEDSRTTLVLTRDAHLPALQGIEPVCIAIDGPDLQAKSDRDPGVDAHAQGLAYLIYTSGSTGRPKGVMVRHQALSHFLTSMRSAPGMTQDDTLVAVTPLSFDIAALELFLPLTVGGKLVLARREVVRDGAALAALVHRSGATMLQSTPAGWRLLRAGGWPAAPLRGFKGLCGGEALAQDLAEDLRGIGVDLWNVYGPTETTIWSTASRVADSATRIAGPIADTQLHVLDGCMRPVPMDVPGELYIGGVGLARGYARKPGLTAERFVADPFGNDATGDRLYRTGDLVRWRASGQIEYLGRLDHQVKIRGYRIELGEIEAQLLAQPEVSSAVVVAAPGETSARLIAYVAAEAEESVDAALVRERLARALPDYMVPATVVVLPSLPLNANGKIDRRALPDPGLYHDRQHEPPSGETEEALARIWCEVLHVERVGRHDNFFELGGHSLAALQVLARVKALGNARLTLSLSDLMRAPTIAELCGQGRARLALAPLNGQRRGSPLFCIHPGMGLVMDYLPLASRLADLKPVMGLSCRTLFDPAHQDESLTQMADDYVAMLKAEQPQGPYALLGWSLGGALAAMMAARLEQAGDCVEFLGLVDPYVPGSSADDAGDWSEAFNAMLRMIMPSVPRSYRLPGETGDLARDEAAVERLAAEALRQHGEGRGARYAGLSAPEMARVFMTGQALARAVAASAEALPMRLRTRVHCWWSTHRADGGDAMLRQQMGACDRLDRHVDAAHSDMLLRHDLQEEVMRLLAP